MKHLLIILISFLLLSSPVMGDNHKGETLYRWIVSTFIYSYRCQVEPCDYKWMGFGDKETHPKYQGQVKDGKPNGLGFIIYPDGGKYVGSWKNGEQNGKGIFTHPEGHKFVGDWKDNRRWNGTEYKNGKIDYKYVNGELQ